MNESLYEIDFYAWTQKQVKLLQAGNWHSLDLTNLIEEIESLGKQQRQELRNRLSVLIGHLLKWQYQPSKRGRSWLATIRLQRREVQELLQENPSLKSYIEQALQSSYKNGVDLAVKETDLPYNTFLADCPYTLLEVLDNDFYAGSTEDWQ
jgi:Domain of unknown function DUF29